MLNTVSRGDLPIFSAARASSTFAPSGRSIEHPGLGTIHYRQLGPHDAPATVVLGGISADRRIDQWWSGVVVPNGVLSPENHRLISIDWLESGPDSRAFPSTGDQADGIAAVLEHLGIRKLEMLVGASYGAMVGLAFASRHAGHLGTLVAISGAHRSTAHASAMRLLQRRIIRDYVRLGKSAEGVALARAVALTGYRPDELFERRFHAAEPARVLQQLESYFDFNGGRFAARFPAQRYLALSESIDHHRVDPRTIRCSVEAISVNSDRLVPPRQMKALAAAIGCRARLHTLDSPYGHDAFLKSIVPLNRLLRKIFNSAAGVKS